MFGVIFLAILALLICELIFLQVGIRDSAIVRRTTREIKIIENINNMEFLKRAQKPSVGFSFYKAYDFLGKRGGLSDLTNVFSYDCAPYLQNYTTKIIPDLKKNIEITSSLIFNKYMDVFVSKGLSPTDYGVTVEDVQPPYPQTLNIDVNCPDNLKIVFEKIQIIEKSNFKHQVPIGLFQEYELAKENLIDTDAIKKTVDDGINSVSTNLVLSGSKTDCGCPSEEDVFKEINNGKSFSDTNNDIKNEIITKTSDLQQNLNSNLGPTIEIKIEPEITTEIKKNCVDTPGDSCDNGNNYCTKNCNFILTAASNVNISVMNNGMKYFVGEEYKKIPFIFRIIDGNLLITPPTNDCAETI